MRVKVTVPFPFSPNGCHVEQKKLGDIVEGRAAEVALAEGWGEIEGVAAGRAAEVVMDALAPIVEAPAAPEPVAGHLVDRLTEPVKPSKRKKNR